MPAQKKEDLEKLIAEEVAAKKADAELKEFNRKEEEKRRLAAELNAPLNVPVNAAHDDEVSSDSEKTAYNAQVVGPDVNALLDDYKTQFNKEPIPKPDGSHVLVFDSEEQAATFFKEQATTKRKFLCMEEGKGVDGDNFFSCGDGKLYEGSISKIIEDLQHVVSVEPDNELVKEGLSFLSNRFPSANPALDFRQVMKEIKPEDGSVAPPPSPKNQA